MVAYLAFVFAQALGVIDLDWDSYWHFAILFVFLAGPPIGFCIWRCIQGDKRTNEAEKEFLTAKRKRVKCKQCEHVFVIALYWDKKKHRCDICNSQIFSIIESLPSYEEVYY